MVRSDSIMSANDTLSFVLCRRLLPMMTLITTAAEMMYLAIFDNSSGKDKLLTKIYVLAVSALIIVTLFISYNFVIKPEAPYLLNGGTTLWDAQTEELADEICAGCDTDAKKVQAIYSWMVTNLEYDYDYHVLFQYFDVRKTLRTKKVFALTFPICLLHFAEARTSPVMLLTEYPIRTTLFSTLGTVCTTTVFGGAWM